MFFFSHVYYFGARFHSLSDRNQKESHEFLPVRCQIWKQEYDACIPLSSMLVSGWFFPETKNIDYRIGTSQSCFQDQANLTSVSIEKRLYALIEVTVVG
jgi:hypothetical protein